MSKSPPLPIPAEVAQAYEVLARRTEQLEFLQAQLDKALRALEPLTDKEKRVNLDQQTKNTLAAMARFACQEASGRVVELRMETLNEVRQLTASTEKH
jgi:hypothetical protein